MGRVAEGRWGSSLSPAQAGSPGRVGCGESFSLTNGGNFRGLGGAGTAKACAECTFNGTVGSCRAAGDASQVAVPPGHIVLVFPKRDQTLLSQGLWEWALLPGATFSFWLGRPRTLPQGAAGQQVSIHCLPCALCPPPFLQESPGKSAWEVTWSQVGVGPHLS